MAKKWDLYPFGNVAMVNPGRVLVASPICRPAAAFASYSSKVQIQHWLPLRRVAGFQQALGFGFVFGAQAGLLAGRAVLHVEHLAAPEQGVFRFHLDYLFRYSSPVSTAFLNASGGKVSASLEQ